MNRATIEKQIGLLKIIHARKLLHPSDDYEPHSICKRSPSLPEDAIYSRLGKSSGQLQFHQSPHTIRVMAPGNGWGGTTAMGIECDAWARHTDRWQQTPPWPVRMIWFCPKYQQFAIVSKELEERCFGSGARLVAAGDLGPRYLWPDGSWLALGSYNVSWKKYQGIQIDLVAFDEVPPAPLWREMLVRRRGSRRTRYICKATQSDGWNWMADDIYKPWLAHHREQGLDEEGAVVAQTHPDTWLWPFGGVHDNPTVIDADVRFQESQTWPSKKERKVRVFGGFESFVGDPVFAEDGLQWLIQNAGAWNERYGPEQIGFIVADDGQSVFDVEPRKLRLRSTKFEFTKTPDPTGYVAIWEGVIPGHEYVIGADFALGLESGDFDAAVVLDATAEQARQVGMIYGHWGETFDKVLYAAIRLWNDAYLMPERQFGLAMIRSILENYGHSWIYHERNYVSRGKPVRDALGWPKHGNRARDPLLTKLRQSVAQKGICWRSRTIVEQMGNLKFVGPKNTEVNNLTDVKLDIELTSGGSPDLVMASMYACQGLIEMGYQVKPTPKYEAGTLGDILQHDLIDKPVERSRRRRRAR